MTFVGFDPGGRGAFGWAVLDVKSSASIARLQAGVAASAVAAWKAVEQRIEYEPAGVGIDAPLYWIDDGDRLADASIRRRVVAAGGHRGTVNAVNSMQGACLVQGILLARRVLTTWPNALVTEAHPKALLRIHAGAQRFASEHFSAEDSEHARDAGLAAYSAWVAFRAEPSWRDLAQDEAGAFFPAGKPATYWFPE